MIKFLKRELAQTYCYPREVLDTQIKSIKVACPNGAKVEGVCLEAFDGAPYLLFLEREVWDSSEINAMMRESASDLETLGVVALVDSSKGIQEVYSRGFRDDEFRRVQGIEYYMPRTRREQFGLFSTSSKGGGASLSQLPITDKLEDIFFDIHSLMRDIDGLHSAFALEELCKIIYLKSFLEEQPDLLPLEVVSASAFGTIEECSASLRALYRAAVDYDLRVFRLKIPEYERSRGVFDAPIYLSSAALVKSFELLEPFSLTNSGADVKGRAFQKVLGKAVRSGMGQYFTPMQVCKMMVEITSPSSSDLVLDPFCGSGHFLSQSLAHVAKSISSSSKEFHEFAFGKLHGIEKSHQMTRIAMTDMRLSGDGHSNIRCTDALLTFDNYPDLKPGTFDIVLTNPPFGSLLGAEAFASLASFELAAGRKKVPLEVVGLERAIEFLRPGGRLGIVLPENVFSAPSMKYVRDWLAERVSIRLIVDLPNETFAPFGANVRSGLLFCRKYLPGERAPDDARVCVIEAECLGYDASGRERPGADIKQVVEKAKSFLSKEGW